jgi:hypothetical protein
MKSFKQYFKEATQPKTKTKSKVNLGPDLDAPQYDQPLSNRTPEQKPQAPADAPERKKASASATARATAGIHNPRMGDMLSRIRNIEAEPEDDDWGFAEPDTNTALNTEVRTANLPAVASANLQTAGVQSPDFHKVSNLPGNMSRAIRTLGKQLFRTLTRTPTDDVYVVANLGGQGPNSTGEVNAVANWVRKNGDDLGDGNIDFDTTIPGYTADIKQYSAGGIRWLLVQDEFGNYIYSWPEGDSVEHANRREITQDRPRLS